MDSALTTEPDMQMALLELMALAGLSAQETPSPENVQEAVEKLKKALAASSAPGKSVAGVPTEARSQHQTVLIAGQIGIILHQLRHELKKLDADITLAKNMDAAIDLFGQQAFSLVILDLFTPSEREGLIVLDEIQRARKQTLTHIIVLAPPCKDQNLQGRCIAKGATHFLEKVDGWQKSILGIYRDDFCASRESSLSP